MTFTDLFSGRANYHGNVPLHLTVHRHQLSVSLAVLTWWHQVRDTPAPRKGRDFSFVTIWLPALSEIPTQPEELADQQKVRSPDVSRRRDSGAEQNTAALSATPAFGAVAMPSAESAWAVAPTSGASALNSTQSPKALKLLAAPSLADQFPFHGRLPATIEQQIAGAAAGSGRWTEEIVDSDHARYRCGNTCAMTERPYAAKIDPFRDSMQRMAWAWKIYPCRRPVAAHERCKRVHQK